MKSLRLIHLAVAVLHLLFCRNAPRQSVILAYYMSIHNDDSYMLGSDTYRVRDEVGYYHWRFGVDGVPHAATCPTCGRKTDAEYINPAFRVHHRRRDIVATYDGYRLVSSRFRDFCIANNWHRDVQFAPLPADDEYFVLRPSTVVKFDSERGKTRFDEHCPKCDHYFSVVGATPVYLRGITETISEGFFRTDLAFASGHEQSPLIILGTETAASSEDREISKDRLETHQLVAPRYAPNTHADI